MVKLPFVLIFCFMASVLYAATYKIAEPDLLEEMLAKKPAMLEELKKNRDKSIERILSDKGVELTPAEKDNIFYVSAEYTLDKDIYRFDKNGGVIGILYPKGYTFNPIDYIIALPPPMVVFNACDAKETAFVEKLQIKDYMPVSSGCQLRDIKSAQMVFLVTDELKEKFRLKHTISVISVDRDKRAFKIQEYKPPEEKK